MSAQVDRNAHLVQRHRVNTEVFKRVLLHSINNARANNKKLQENKYTNKPPSSHKAIDEFELEMRMWSPKLYRALKMQGLRVPDQEKAIQRHGSLDACLFNVLRESYYWGSSIGKQIDMFIHELGLDFTSRSSKERFASYFAEVMKEYTAKQEVKKSRNERQLQTLLEMKEITVDDKRFDSSKWTLDRGFHSLYVGLLESDGERVWYTMKWLLKQHPLIDEWFIPLVVMMPCCLSTSLLQLLKRLLPASSYEMLRLYVPDSALRNFLLTHPFKDKLEFKFQSEDEWSRFFALTEEDITNYAIGFRKMHKWQSLDTDGWKLYLQRFIYGIQKDNPLAVWAAIDGLSEANLSAYGWLGICIVYSMGCSKYMMKWITRRLNVYPFLPMEDGEIDEIVGPIAELPSALGCSRSLTVIYALHQWMNMLAYI